MYTGPIYIRKDDKILSNFIPAIYVPQERFVKSYNDYTGPVLIRGVGKRDIIKFCKEIKKNFYYVDTGYFGNIKRKIWHRITKNKTEAGDIIDRPEDRLLKIFNYNNIEKLYADKLKPWDTSGKNILICAPNSGGLNMHYSDYSEDEWINAIIRKIKKFSNKNIIVRKRTRSRAVRTGIDSLQYILKTKSIFVTVVFNSNAAIESICSGIPVITLGPNAASSISSCFLSEIENPLYSEDREKWLRHLSYSQFSGEEIQNGKAWELLNQA